MKRVLVDANLLVLLLVGIYDPAYVKSHKKTKGYTRDDFEMLVEILRECNSTIVVTPAILAETSNLIASCNEPMRSELKSLLGESLSQYCEVLQPSIEYSTKPEFTLLGLTDSGILNLPEPVDMILTDDSDLHRACLEKGLVAEHFKHWRIN